MENFIKAYTSMFIGFFLTLSALGVTVWMLMDWGKEFDGVKENDAVYVEQIEIPKEVLYTGSQVIVKTFKAEEEEIVVVVNGVEIKTEKDAEMYQSSIPVTRMYSSTTVVDSKGNVTKVNYRVKGV